MRTKYIKAPREEWGEHKCICIFFGLSVYISPSVADSDLLCVLLVHYVTRTKSIHAILKTQIKLKLLRSSPPPVSFLGQFFFFLPLCGLCCLCASRAQRNMQRFWITDKTELGALLLSICPRLGIRKALLSLPSLLSADLQRKEPEAEGRPQRESRFFLCL